MPLLHLSNHAVYGYHKTQHSAKHPEQACTHDFTDLVSCFPFVSYSSPIIQERRICVKKHLDISHLSGQLGIHSSKLQAWLNLTGLTVADPQDRRERRSERMTFPYRLVTSTSPLQATSSRAFERYRSRFSNTGSRRRSRALRGIRRINKL
ncbi:hypothetical protein SAMN05720606_104267 [Paenibacillus polysaccharolyticus]|uniref:Uncharacterized protein n=1 Tax=Paenibacillus polysaccharolyticus TaxID=582692 RepID=A0A1G5FN59_9BACL|nr:hypothetical protein SAMN05720606_104267 [Paenibacillus polysaccharolyticus]